MKTLRLTLLDVGTTWLETDQAFRTLFQADPTTLELVAKLTPGSMLYFSVPGKSVTLPAIGYRVTRIAWPDPPASLVDVVAPLLALAIFVTGAFMVPR